MKLWEKDGKLVTNAAGTALIECTDCPCDEETGFHCRDGNLNQFHCCEPGATDPASCDVVIPLNEFSDGLCTNCDTQVDNQTFSCSVVSPATPNCTWRYSGSLCTTGGVIVTAKLDHNESSPEECRMTVTIELTYSVGLSGGTLTANYASSWVSAPLDCTGMTWTCNYVSQSSTGTKPCNLAATPTSVTATPNY